MKKLLGILGTITMAGGGTLTVVANSPAPTQQEETELLNNEINYLQTDNLGNLNRNKRENIYSDIYHLPDGEVNLNVQSIAQSERLSCGPAVATSILRYFGLSNLQITNETPYICERRLISNMQTDDGSLYSALPGGTMVENWVNTVNRYVRHNMLNNLRQYTSLTLHNSILDPNVNRVNITFDYSNHYLGISRFVYNSLINNMPVPLGFTGRFNESENNRNHFILIYGISISPNNVIFRYMDPDGGRRGSFSADQLNSLLINGGYLIYHDPYSQSETQIPRPNQTTLMEMGNCNNGPVSQFVRENFYCNIKTRTERSYLNNNLSCPSDSNPYYEHHGKDNTNNDYFKVTGKSGHDRVELKMSLKTAVAFENFFHQNNKLKIKNYLKNLINHVEQKNETWSGGSILDTDKELMKNFIYDGYQYFHEKLLELVDAETKKSKNNSIFIRTWRTYSWRDLSEQEQNSAFYIK